MSSFFEKLKRGMGIEESEIKKTEKEKQTKSEEKKKKAGEKEKKKRKKRIIKKIEIKEKLAEPKTKEKTAKKEMKKEVSPIKPLPSPQVAEEAKEKVSEEKPILTPPPATQAVEKKENEKTKSNKIEQKEKWMESEGQLAVDVYQTPSHLVIQSAIAGVKAEELNISIEGDMINIEGERKKPVEEEGDYFFRECYWGKFSRQIIIPVEVDPNRVEAELKEGVLTIRLPKVQREKKRKIVVRG